MESSPQQAMPPESKNLENYALSYMGSYLNAVKNERPEHLPPFARNGPYDIEVCVLPNGCFALIFMKAEKERVQVFERGWEYVESKVATSPVHLVTVYPHEKSAIADAIARGKKDASRDIRAVEDSDIARAVLQLEKIMDTLKGLEKGNKTTLKAARAELEKMRPLWESARKAGPEVDMLALIDAMKNYPPAPITVTVDVKDKELLERTVAGLGDTSDLLRRLENQDRKLEDLEQSMRKVFAEYSRSIDERITKGLEVVLESETKKRLEGQNAVHQKVMADVESRLTKMDAIGQLEPRLANLEAMAHHEKDDGVAKEIILAVADIRATMDQVSARVTKLESTTGLSQRVRTLKK